MFASPVTTEDMLEHAVAVARLGEASLLGALDELPAAIYVTDADGLITYFNKACIGLSGRTPKVGADRWCVTWKIYTDEGEFLPHDQCPMAVAIRERRSVRGATAVAERPDGERVNFLPYPTPVFDDAGVMTGAVNLLVDITDLKRVEFLRAQAERCRRLAASVGPNAGDTLMALAADYDRLAARALASN